MQIIYVKISDMVEEFEKDCMKTEGLKDSSFDEKNIGKLGVAFPVCRQGKAASYKSPEDQTRCIAAGLLLGYAMKKKGISLSEVPFFGDGGKMQFNEKLHFQVNLSHGGDIAACAFGENAVGVDVERIRPCKENVLSRVGTENEVMTILGMESKTKRDQAFTRLWTQKESWAKLSGEGIFAYLEQGADHGRVTTYEICDDYYLSVASEQDDFPKNPTKLSWSELLTCLKN